LEMFNNLIQYQYEGNSRFIYSILKAQNEFSKLVHLRIFTTPINQAPPNPEGAPNGQPQPQPAQVDHQIQEEVPVGQEQPQQPYQEPIHEEHAEPANEELAQAQAEEDHAEEQIHEPERQPIEVRQQAAEYDQKAQELPQEAQEEPKQPEVPVHASIETPVNPQVVHPQQVEPQQPLFVPTNEWLESWKRLLPMDNILRIITSLSPQIQSICTGGSTDEVQVLGYLQRSTLVGLLPVPHPILIRKYQPNEATQIWLLSYMWGTIYLHHTNPPLFMGSQVKLFILNTVQVPASS